MISISLQPASSTALLVLFLVCTEALRRLDAQRRLDASERGNAKEDDGNEHEKDEKQADDERRCEQLVSSEDATSRWGRRGRGILARRTSQNDKVARVGAGDSVELSREPGL